jgi:hypothetical protein
MRHRRTSETTLIPAIAFFNDKDSGIASAADGLP